jgi:peptide/nickel transport system substrate-binding protein
MTFAKLARTAGAALLAAAAALAQAADLRVALSADVTSMDPHFATVAPNIAVSWHVFDALTRVDENARLVPGLAESWRAIDPTTWEFRLRRGVKFHDGAELTAEDVLFSLDRPATIAHSPGPFTTFTKSIVSKEAPDSHTVRLRTREPYAMLPYDVQNIFIVSRRVAAGATGEDFNSGKAMVGTGPFRFVSFKRGDRVELARHDAYWDERPAWDRVTLRILPADPARVAALLAGEVDAVEYLPTADAARLKRDARYRIAEKVSWRTVFLHLDQERDRAPFVTDKAGRPLDRNPFRDARVRLAVSKAINRRAIAERVMEGFAVPASNLVSPPVFGHVAALQPEAHDVEGAKRLLAEAGYPDGFGITLHAPNDRYVNDERVAQSIAQMLARAGIAAKVEAMPVAVYFPRARNREFGVALLGWGSMSGDLALRSVLMTFDAERGWGAWNWGRYANPKVDALVVQAFATVDDARREALAREAATLALRDQAIVPVHHQVATWAMRAGLDYTPRTDEFTLAHRFRPR